VVLPVFSSCLTHLAFFFGSSISILSNSHVWHPLYRRVSGPPGFFSFPLCEAHGSRDMPPLEADTFVCIPFLVFSSHMPLVKAYNVFCCCFAQEMTAVSSPFLLPEFFVINLPPFASPRSYFSCCCLPRESYALLLELGAMPS